jgi:tetratricopeptide (TPR) repeat protein
VQGPDERVWVQRTLPEIDNLRAAFDWAMAAGEIDLAVRLATALPELSRLRLGYESMEWAERALAVTPRDHPLFAATVGAAARGAWNLGDFAKARRLAALAGDRSPGRGAARIGYPRDVQADVALYEDDAAAALSYYREQVAIARRDGDPIRLVWTLYYVAICHAVLRRPDMGLDAARESVRVAATTANPTAESMARYALGLVLKKADPPRALALFDEAAARAESVHNAWWQGIALMEAAATRAVHGDPAVAAAELVVVLDLWEHAGDITQQWLTLRYVVRLLTALGADSDARVLHHALLAAGRPSPLTAEQVATSGGNGVGGGMPVDAALAHARACLRRWFLDHDHRL